MQHLGKYNLAVACGEVSQNLVVFDFEIEADAWFFFQKDSILRSTLCVRTAHKGIHVYFRTLDKCPRRQTKLCSPEHTFDLCGEGGYVVAAPSTVDHSLCDPKKENCPHFGTSSYEIISETKEIKTTKALEAALNTRVSQLGWKLRRSYDGQELGDFEDIFKTALSNDKELADLYSGNLLTHKSRSEAEFRLCSKLVSIGFPDQAIFKIMDSCKIGKWQEKEDSYRYRTLERARRFKAQTTVTKQVSQETKNEVEELEKAARADPQPRNLANLIIKLHHFATFNDSGDVYIYSNGIFCPNAEAIIQSAVDRFTNGNSTMKMRSEVVDMIRIRTFRKREEFNQHLDLLAFDNGIYDLKNGIFLEHDPKYLFLSKLAVKYDPEADCHNFWKYLKQCQPDPKVRVQLLEAMAFCLDRKPRRRKSYMFLGEKGTGKTTFLNVLRKLLGSENCSAESLQSLSGDDKFATSMIYNKMANIYADISDVELELTGPYKLTTGCDMVPAQFKHKPKFYFVPFAKFFFSANQLPKVSDDADLAFFDRWFIFHWNMQFVNEPDPDNPRERKRIPDLEDQLSTERELSGLLNFLLYRLKQIRMRGDLLDPPSAEQVQAVWKMKSDFTYQFLKDELLESSSSTTPKSMIQHVYLKWCEKKRIAPESETALNEIIRREFGTRVKEVRPRIDGKQQKSWQGVALRQEIRKQNSSLDHETDLPDFSRKEASPEAVRDKKVQKIGHIGLSNYALTKSYTFFQELFK